MKPHHVRVHPFRVNRVSADLARHGAGRFSHRLFLEEFRLAALPTFGFTPWPAAFRILPSPRYGTTVAAVSHME